MPEMILPFAVWDSNGPGPSLGVSLLLTPLIRMPEPANGVVSTITVQGVAAVHKF